MVKRTFFKFKIKIENFNILKPQAGPKKVMLAMQWNRQNTLLIS
jgi:hypothetical protein